MAGDWIKMTHALPEKPEVLAIAGKTTLNRFEVVGRLFALWRWFDINTTDGNAPGVTSVTLNECLFGYGDATEFVTAVVSVRWLDETGDGISVVKFEEHISESAKTRAQTAKRVAKSKAKDKGNAEGNGESVTYSVTKTVPREEKRREEKKEGDSAAVAASPARKPKSAKTGMPDDFDVSERVRDWAAEKGYGHLDEHLDAFKRKVKAKDYTYASWDDAFMEAIREDWAKLRGRTVNGVSAQPRARGLVL